MKRRLRHRQCRDFAMDQGRDTARRIDRRPAGRIGRIASHAPNPVYPRQDNQDSGSRRDRNQAQAADFVERRGGLLDHFGLTLNTDFTRASRDTGHEQQDVGRTLRIGTRSDHGGHQRLDPLRPPPLPAGHRRQQGPCGDARQTRHHHGARCKADRSRSRHDPVRDRGRQILVQAGARRHPHECREPAGDADRAGRGTAAYRALAQRSGGDRFPALGARRHR